MRWNTYKVVSYKPSYKPYPLVLNCREDIYLEQYSVFLLKVVDPSRHYFATTETNISNIAFVRSTPNKHGKAFSTTDSNITSISKTSFIFTVMVQYVAKNDFLVARRLENVYSLPTHWSLTSAHPHSSPRLYKSICNGLVVPSYILSWSVGSFRAVRFQGTIK